MSGDVLPFDGSGHRAADALLPWFVNGTLDDEDRTGVVRHLRECARCRHEVIVLSRLQAFCATDRRSRVPMRDGGTAVVRMKDIGARSGTKDRMERLRDSWHRAPKWTRWAIAAQFVAIVGLTSIVAAQSGGSASTYRTLGDSARANPPGSIAVAFAPGITERELRRIVEAAGGRIVDGPTMSNMFVVQVPARRRAEALATVRAEPAVVLAEPLAE